MQQSYIIGAGSGAVKPAGTMAGVTWGRQGTVAIEYASYRRGDIVHLWVRGQGLNAWWWAWPVAPRDPILWNLHLTEQGGNVSLGSGSWASKYPSLAIFYYHIDVQGETVSNTVYMQTENSMSDLGFLGALRSRGMDWWERPRDFDLFTNFNGRTIIDGHPQ
jgi:hypothetical protein